MDSKKLKYIISIGSFIISVIIFLILFFNIPRLTYSYNEEYEGYFIKNAYGNSKEYEIPREYKNVKIVGIDERAFLNHSKLERVELPSTIKVIERLAFSECDNLSSINLENVEVIYRNAFSYCRKLNNITVGAKSIGASAFYKCEALDNVVLLDTTFEIGSMAFSHTAITSIFIPRNVFYLQNDCFYGCYALRNINVYGNNLKNNQYLKQLDIVTYIG